MSYESAQMLMLFVYILIYAYTALCIQFMAKKADVGNAWMAWLPIANIFILLAIAGKPAWWFILLMIPLVNVIIGIIIWMSAAESCGKPNWLGILMIIPIINFVIMGYLAFSRVPSIDNSNFIDGYAAREPQHRTIPHTEPPAENNSDFPDNKPIA